MGEDMDDKPPAVPPVLGSQPPPSSLGDWQDTSLQPAVPTPLPRTDGQFQSLPGKELNLESKDPRGHQAGTCLYMVQAIPEHGGLWQQPLPHRNNFLPKLNQLKEKSMLSQSELHTSP